MSFLSDRLSFWYSSWNIRCEVHVFSRSHILVFVLMWLLYELWWKRRSYPPGPMPFPFFGNLLQLNQITPHESFLKWREVYGPVYTIWIPKPMIIFADFASINATFNRGNVTAFAGRPKGHLWSAFYGKNEKEGDGIILAEGERWRENREFAMSYLRNTIRGEDPVEKKVQLQVDNLLNFLSRQLGKNTCVTVDVHIPFAYVVGNIIQSLLFGGSHSFGDPQFLEFKHMIDTVLKDTASPTMLLANSYWLLSLVLPVRYRFIKNGFNLQKWFKSMVDEHEKKLDDETEPQDFMDCYIKEMRKQTVSAHFNVSTLCLSAGDIWTGGMETTVTTLRWAIIYFLHYPRVQFKCQEEIANVLGCDKPTYGRRSELPYMNATIAELQRIVNVLPWSIPHRTLERVSILGHTVEKGVDLMPQYGCVLYDQNVFPNPTLFHPSRFINKEGKFRTKSELKPFGVGPRVCMGEKVARYELFLILTNLIQRFTFKPIPGQPLPSLSRHRGMTSVPSDFDCLIERNTNIGCFNG